MKEGIYTVFSNEQLTENCFKMSLTGDTSAITAAGQFINIRIDGLFLRRPISVFDCEEGRITIIYKVVGKGTQAMSEMPRGTKLSFLTGLGNGYSVCDCGDMPLLVGGGVGVPPLYYLAKALLAAGKSVQVTLGFNKRDEIICARDFLALGCDVTVATADGSYGVKGFVTDALPASYSYVYACGPEPMLKALYRAVPTGAQFSFEARMGCGFGACMGCTCKTITGNKRICKDGPVLRKEEILWED